MKKARGGSATDNEGEIQKRNNFLSAFDQLLVVTTRAFLVDTRKIDLRFLDFRIAK